MRLIIALGFLVLAIVQLYAGGVGIAYHFGLGWAIIAIILCLMFRFGIPIAIGSFLCARDVWGWNELYSLLFAVPGLIFIIPSVFIGILAILSVVYKNFKK